MAHRGLARVVPRPSGRAPRATEVPPPPPHTPRIVARSASCGLDEDRRCQSRSPGPHPATPAAVGMAGGSAPRGRLEGACLGALRGGSGPKVAPQCKGFPRRRSRGENGGGGGGQKGIGLTVHDPVSQ